MLRNLVVHTVLRVGRTVYILRPSCVLNDLAARWTIDGSGVCCAETALKRTSPSLGCPFCETVIVDF